MRALLLVAALSLVAATALAAPVAADALAPATREVWCPVDVGVVAVCASLMCPLRVFGSPVCIL